MRPALTSLGAAMLLAVTLSGCETKVTEISIVCRPGHRVTEPVRWIYTSKVDPSVIERIPVMLDITLHYTGGDPRTAPPITTYFYRKDGAALRVASSTKAVMPPKGAFTYHIDTGGYSRPLNATGHGDPEELALFIKVDGSYFDSLLLPRTCARWPDGHLDVDKASQVPNLKDKHPLNMAASDWITVSSLPTAIMRMEGTEVSTYAFFPGPIALTETKNETSVPDDSAKQTAEVGVTATTPTYAIAGEPTPQAGNTAGAANGG